MVPKLHSHWVNLSGVLNGNSFLVKVNNGCNGDDLGTRQFLFLEESQVIKVKRKKKKKKEKENRKRKKIRRNHLSFLKPICGVEFISHSVPLSVMFQLEFQGGVPIKCRIAKKLATDSNHISAPDLVENPVNLK